MQVNGNFAVYRLYRLVIILLQTTTAIDDMLDATDEETRGVSRRTFLKCLAVLGVSSIAGLAVTMPLRAYAASVYQYDNLITDSGTCTQVFCLDKMTNYMHIENAHKLMSLFPADLDFWFQTESDSSYSFEWVFKRDMKYAWQTSNSGEVYGQWGIVYKESKNSDYNKATTYNGLSSDKDYIFVPDLYLGCFACATDRFGNVYDIIMCLSVEAVHTHNNFSELKKAFIPICQFNMTDTSKLGNFSLIADGRGDDIEWSNASHSGPSTSSLAVGVSIILSPSGFRDQLGKRFIPYLIPFTDYRKKYYPNTSEVSLCNKFWDFLEGLATSEAAGDGLYPIAPSPSGDVFMVWRDLDIGDKHIGGKRDDSTYSKNDPFVESLYFSTDDNDCICYRPSGNYEALSYQIATSVSENDFFDPHAIGDKLVRMHASSPSNSVNTPDGVDNDKISSCVTKLKLHRVRTNSNGNTEYGSDLHQLVGLSDNNDGYLSTGEEDSHFLDRLESSGILGNALGIDFLWTGSGCDTLINFAPSDDVYIDTKIVKGEGKIEYPDNTITKPDSYRRRFYIKGDKPVYTFTPAEGWKIGYIKVQYHTSSSWLPSAATSLDEVKDKTDAYSYTFEHWNTSEPGALYEHENGAIKLDEDGKKVSIPVSGLSRDWRIQVKFVQDSADVWFYKQDAETSDDRAQGDAVLGGTALVSGHTNNGAAFKVYKSDGSAFKVGDAEMTEITVTTPENDPTKPAKLEKLELGDYCWQETVAPDGYVRDDTVHTFSLTSDWDTEEQPLIQENPVIRGNIRITKVDRDAHNKKNSDSGTPQGDGSFVGAKFEVVNKSAQKVKVGSTEYAVGAVVATVYIESGNSVTVNNLPYGTYLVREVASDRLSSYDPNTAWSDTVQIREQGKTYDVSKPADDPVWRNAIKIIKQDKDTNRDTPQGDASFVGAAFVVKNTSAHYVYYNDKRYEVGQDVCTVYIESGNTVTVNNLSYGTYEVREIASSRLIGYDPDLNWRQTVVAHGKGETYPVAVPVKDPVWRGGLKLQKIDYDLTIDNANKHKIDLDWPGPQGNAFLEGAEFLIFNGSASYVKVNGVVHDNTYRTAAAVGNPATNSDWLVKLVTDSDGRAQTAIDTLPYGTYWIFETKPPEGYLLNDRFAAGVKFTIHEKGGWYIYDGEGNFIL